MVKIIKLHSSQALRFKSVRLRSLKEDPDAFGSKFEDAAEWADSKWVAQVDTLATFLASLDQQDVGVARFAWDDNESGVGWVISMWVAPEARGQKVATRLLQSIIDWAKNQGVRVLRLDVADANTGAIRLYENFGFIANSVKGAFPEPRGHITEHQRELRL